MTTQEIAPPPRSGWRILGRLCLLALLTYVGIVVLLVIFENPLVFPRATAEQSWLPKPNDDVQDVELTCANGTKIHGWYLPCPGSTEGMLYFHGNGGNLSHRGGLLVQFRDTLQANVLIIDYPGYGKSEGRPTETGCYQAADAAYDWMTETQKIEPRRVILLGKSLGGGVASYLASTREHRALVLLKTYTRLPDVAASVYPWVPVRLLMSNRFDTIDRLEQCHRPIFIAHGTEDHLIPYAHSERLFAAAHEPKELYPFPGDHNSPFPDAMFVRLREFLQAHPVAVNP